MAALYFCALSSSGLMAAHTPSVNNQVHPNVTARASPTHPEPRRSAAGRAQSHPGLRTRHP